MIHSTTFRYAENLLNASQITIICTWLSREYLFSEDLDNPRISSLDEIIVNLEMLDLFEKGEKINIFTDLPKAEQIERVVSLVDKIVVSDTPLEYPELYSSLQTALLGRIPTYLCDMPEVLNRKILGNLISCEESRKIFQIVREKKAKSIFSMRDATFMLFSHLFQAKRDEYIASIIKETASKHTRTLCLVGMQHFNPIKAHLEFNEELDFKAAAATPRQVSMDKLDLKLEKQVIFDVLLEDSVWERPSAGCSFNYMQEDFEEYTEEDFKLMRESHKMLKKGYEACSRNLSEDFPTLKYKETK